ncbi:MAG TPA: GFA family protein [Candidatus Binataceae bacterium]|nr:GFA family protein [Candidatus Binataceae bacterium]
MSNEAHEGGCLCGAVRYRVTGHPNVLLGVCRCNFCKRRTGSAFGISAYFDEAAVQITGELKTYQYHSDESARWLKTAFRPTCGTTVTLTSEAHPGARCITVGTFDDPNWLKPTRHVWTRSALHWIVFPPNVELMATMT